MNFPPPGTIVISRDCQTLVEVWPEEGAGKRCFAGVDLFTGDTSVLFLKKAFEETNLFKTSLLRKYIDLRKAARSAA